jgi:pilus assembly protein Flp/PilA
MTRAIKWRDFDLGRIVRRLADQQGQDLIEYALLAGFVAVAGGALIPWGATGPMSSIFSSVSNLLVQLGGGRS